MLEVPLGLALYERVRLSCVSVLPSDQLDDEVRDISILDLMISHYVICTFLIEITEICAVC